MRLLVATQNAFKKKELTALLGNKYDIVSLSDLSDTSDVEETGDTFFENALLKASYYAKKHQILTLSDDTGLCVESLNGAPGIFSQRYSGLGDEANIDLLLKELESSDNRSAKFVTVLVLFDPDTLQNKSYKGELHGLITKERRGSNGFGYDAVFLVPELGKTLAEIDQSLKNQISHRAMALKALEADLL